MMRVQKWIALIFIFSEVALSKPGLKPRTYIKSGANKSFEILTANKKYQLKQDQNSVVTSWNNQGVSHRLKMEYFPSYIEKNHWVLKNSQWKLFYKEVQTLLPGKIKKVIFVKNYKPVEIESIGDGAQYFRTCQQAAFNGLFESNEMVGQIESILNSPDMGERLTDLIDFDSACGDIDDLVEESLAQGMECLSNVGGEGDRMNVQLASLMMYPQHYKYSRQASNSITPFGLSDIANHRFRITCSNSETGVSLSNSVQGYMNSCHEEFPLLYLSSSYMNSSESETSKKETVFHEMLHALGYTHSDVPDRTFACSRLCFEDFIDNDTRDSLEDYCNGTVTTEDSNYWDNMFSVNQIGDATVLTSIRYSRTPESVDAIAQYLDSLTSSEIFAFENLEMAFRELALNANLSSQRYAHQDRFMQSLSNYDFNSQDITTLRSLGQRYLNGENVDREVDNLAEQFYNRRSSELQSRLNYGLISQSDYNRDIAIIEEMKEALEASFVSH